LVEYGKPAFGVIYAPVDGLLYWGSSATGSFKAEHVFEWGNHVFSDAKKLQPGENKGNLRVAASRSHLDERTKEYIQQLETKFGTIEFVSKGSSLKLCMIAEGETDIYPRFSRTMEWDTAAGHAIVAGTGGMLFHEGSQEELSYNKSDISNAPFFALSGLQVKRMELFI
jgi:3'(2'), 5'-bisphosphate nucleotidase